MRRSWLGHSEDVTVAEPAGFAWAAAYAVAVERCAAPALAKASRFSSELHYEEIPAFAAAVDPAPGSRLSAAEFPASVRRAVAAGLRAATILSVDPFWAGRSADLPNPASVLLAARPHRSFSEHSALLAATEYWLWTAAGADHRVLSFS